MAVLQGASPARRETMMGTLIAERLTGVPAESYSNAAMQWGNAQEPFARKAYQFECMTEVEQVGFVLHPKIANAGASPDGLVGARGLVEIKCPNTSTHLEALLGEMIPHRYAIQMHWQMACCERDWCDFVSFDPRMPERMQLFIKRLHRSDNKIASLETLVSAFLAEADNRIAKLERLYQPMDEAAE